MKWVEFVKDYAKKNNIKYGEALKKAKDGWKKHKAESHEHTSKKTKPKKKAKKSKSKTHKMPNGDIHTGAKHTKNSKLVSKAPNLQMKISQAKKKNVEFALVKDQLTQESLKKRKAKEELEEALSKEKGLTELILEARAKGFSAAEAPQEARKLAARQKIKFSELKSDAGVPIGGGFDTKN